MTYVIETLVTFENDVVAVEVFTVDGGKPRVRVIDIDSGEVLPTIKVFQDIDAAVEYARRCV